MLRKRAAELLGPQVLGGANCDLGKPTLNCALSNKMKFVAQGDAGVLFQAVVAGPDGQPAVQKLLLRTRKGEGGALLKQLEALAQAQAS